MNKIRLVILLVLVVPSVLCGLGFAAYQFISGEGKARLVAPGDSELSYSLDGSPTLKLPKGGNTMLKLKQGKHTLELESTHGKTQRVVDVKNGFVDLLVPADDGQCFVVLDVSRSHFQYGSKTPAKYPGVKARVKSSETYDLPGSIHFTESSLPSSLKEGSACNLVQEVECKLLDQDDTEMLVAMGF
ncbi:MAG: hypothetical protein AMXMBFR34_22520 [Myxococcaceae bacterium]